MKIAIKMSAHNTIDLTGQVFGRLYVISRSGYRSENAVWLCRCVCGSLHKVRSTSLRSGKVRSCGCLAREKSAENGRANATHGHTTGRGYSPTYVSWKSMVSRCTKPYATSYPRYGGRGITVCDRWLNSFEAFLADMGERPPGKTLDRYPDNRGNYEPGNCRWASNQSQSRNRSSARKITLNGRTQLLSDWANETGIKISTLAMRLDAYRWPVERALTTPVRRTDQ